VFAAEFMSLPLVSFHFHLRTQKTIILPPTNPLCSLLRGAHI